MNMLLRDERGRILPGQPALNPGGRPRMPKQVRCAIQQNGAKAVERMEALLNDDEAFGPAAWMSPRDQIRLLEVAIERAFGKPEIVRAEAPGAASITRAEDYSRRLIQICDRLDFPEFRNAKPAGGSREHFRTSG